MFRMYGLQIGCNPEILHFVMSYDDDDAAMAWPPSSPPLPPSRPQIVFIFTINKAECLSEGEIFFFQFL